MLTLRHRPPVSERCQLSHADRGRRADLYFAGEMI